jgi:hypothetical protein
MLNQQIDVINKILIIISLLILINISLGFQKLKQHIKAFFRQTFQIKSNAKKIQKQTCVVDSLCSISTVAMNRYRCSACLF